ELDAGSDPADPASVPTGATTTTSTTNPGATTTTTTPTPPSSTLIRTSALKLTDKLDPPGSSKVSFKSSTKEDPVANRIVTPPPGSAADPRVVGVTLRIYNSAGLTSDTQTNFLSPQGWTLLGSASKPKGYRYRGRDAGDAIVKSMTIKPDGIKLSGASFYSLD